MRGDQSWQLAGYRRHSGKRLSPAQVIISSVRVVVQYGGSWHTVVGENFSASITYDTGMVLHIHFGGKARY